MRNSSKPLVGINTDLRIPAKGRGPVSVVAAGYYDCVFGSGGVPIIIPPLTKEPELRPIVDRLDAMVLIGGDDLDPKRIGMTPHPATRAALPRREDSDRLLVRMATERKMPLLAIGLSMQLINVMNG